MTVWEKIENENCYAVAIYNFAGTCTAHLPLEVGELVHLKAETSEWYYGTSVRRDVSGAFPKNYVCIRDCIVDRCGTTVVASAGGAGVVHDIAVTLREWLHHWKKLYMNNDELFKFMEVSMRTLLELRAQAASGALPLDQLRRVARTSVFTIDRGNRALGMELAVRNASGQLVDPLEMSTYRLNMLHEEANTRIDKKMEGTPATPPPPASGVRTYAVCVRVYNFVCRMGDAAELALALHDAAGNKLTEHLLLRWPPYTVAPTSVLFTDFGSDFMKSEKIFLVCHVVRIGSMDAQNHDHRRSSVAPASGVSGGSWVSAASAAGAMRRPFGVACADIKRALAEDNPDKHIQVPFYAYEKEYLDTLLKKVMTNRDLKDAKNPQGLWVSLQFIEGDLKQIREENPHLVVGNPAIARKMGFPEVIMPGDARNDLYVTICSGSFTRGGGKSSDRNIELVARVVDKNGIMLPGVVSVGANIPLADEYTSIVYYHDDRPRWQEVFKVCLDIEKFKEAHLVFLCRHRSSNEAKDRAERHFVLAFLRLMQREGTTAPDGYHQLAIYKIEHKRATSGNVDAEAAAACLALPSRRDELPAGAEKGLTRGVLSLVHKDSLTVATKLCSTKLTQRVEILGVLKWSTQHTEGKLRGALMQLLHVPSEELVKFLQDILDALFNILTQVEEDHENYTDESYSVLVLECLLRVISLVADHKYQHFQPVLHVYIDESFCDAMAYENLISVMVWVIRAAGNGEAALKRLLVCMKCAESLVRVIVRSRQLRSALGDSAADRDFTCLFESFLESIVELMQRGDYALTCQGSALKYLPHAVPHAIKVYPATDLCAYIARFLDALPLGRLSKQRMLALLELVRGPVFKAPQGRALLLPHLAATIRGLLRDKAEWDREAALKSRSVGKAARLLGENTSRLHEHTHHHEIVELCVETLGEVMTLLGRDDVGPVEMDRGELARRLLPTVLKTAASMLRERANEEHFSTADETLVRRMVSVLLDMVRQMSEEQYALLVKALEQESADSSGSLVNDALALILTLLQHPVYRSHWADMLHLQYYVMLRALRLLSSTMAERLQSAGAGGGEGEAASAAHAQCRSWFEAGAALATAAPLQLEALSAAGRRRVTQLYGDIRRSLARCLRDMWFTLGEHRMSFIPCLVKPFLEVSFLRDDDVRNTTIPIFFDMMQTEYSHNVMRDENEENYLKEMESELVDKVDVLVERGRGDAEWRSRFVRLCGALCREAAGPLRAAAAGLVAVAARQLDALLLYRAAVLRSSSPHRMHLTTVVLDFYDGIDRPHMYIRYVHKLCSMHSAMQQWAEAGLTLRLHAKLLRWTQEPLPARLAHPALRHHTHATHRDLKEHLYSSIAELLKRGRQWELAVEIVKELVSVYEEEALGYGPLAELHGQLADLYTAMLRTPRCHPVYFRVIYYGKGFPELLRKPLNNEPSLGFVYRANEYEQLHDFRERLLDEWPDAEILSKLDPPGEEITESDGQYLQINALDTVMSDRLKRLSGKPIAEQILQYYKHNDVYKFYFSRPVHKPDEALWGSSDDLLRKNTFATMWLERTELEIKDKLPGVLRWSPVVQQKQYSLSPLEAALESMRESNRKLKSITCEARAADAPLHPLTMRLTGILDPAVQGGIDNYEKSFLTPAYESRHPEHGALLTELKDLIADQIPLLKFALDVHGSRAPAELEQSHNHLLTCFRRLQQHVHQRYGRKLCDFDADSMEVQFRTTLRDSLHTDPGNLTSNRMSDASTENDGPSKSSGRFFSFNSAINPRARNSNVSVAGYFGTLQNSPRRRNKRNVRKSEVGTQASSTQSQWYTSYATPNGSAGSAGAAGSVGSAGSAHSPAQPDSAAASPLRELRQELVTERPLRADVEREKRLSARTSFINNSAPPSNRDSMGTTDSNQEEEEPPPLPKKYAHRSMDLDNDANNNGDVTPLPRRQNYDTVWSPRDSRLYSSIVPRRAAPRAGGGDAEKAPTPPPKKKNAN